MVSRRFSAKSTRRSGSKSYFHTQISRISFAASASNACRNLSAPAMRNDWSLDKRKNETPFSIQFGISFKSETNIPRRRPASLPRVGVVPESFPRAWDCFGVKEVSNCGAIAAAKEGR